MKCISGCSFSDNEKYPCHNALEMCMMPNDPEVRRYVARKFEDDFYKNLDEIMLTERTKGEIKEGVEKCFRKCGIPQAEGGIEVFMSYLSSDLKGVFESMENKNAVLQRIRDFLSEWSPTFYRFCNPSESRGP